MTTYAYDVMNRLLARTAQCATPRLRRRCGRQLHLHHEWPPRDRHGHPRRERVRLRRPRPPAEPHVSRRPQPCLPLRPQRQPHHPHGHHPRGRGGAPTVLTTGYTYDDANRLDLVTDAAGRIYDHGYDANGNRTTLAQPNGTLTSYAYNTLNRLTTLTTTHAGLRHDHPRLRADARPRRQPRTHRRS